MLLQFLKENEKEILDLTAKKSLELTGVLPSSDLLKKGLPFFYKQLLGVLLCESEDENKDPPQNKEAIKDAAKNNDEPTLAKSMGHPKEAALAVTAGEHGMELQRLGYTLSHVVHAYGAICQAITEVASKKKALITSNEFHDMNRCLDIAIAGAVTKYQAQTNIAESGREVKHLGFLAHELRNALGLVTLSLQLIKNGTVGFGGSTGKVLDHGLKRMEELISRSLTEVRLQVDPKVYMEPTELDKLIHQILVTAEIEAHSKNQTIDFQIDASIIINVDQQLFYSAISNIIQNAIKYTRNGGKIKIRGSKIDEKIVVEVEDECGGLKGKSEDLFKPYEQQNEDREGLGLGLTIAKRSVILNDGVIRVDNLPGKGCIFKITLPSQPGLTMKL